MKYQSGKNLPWWFKSYVLRRKGLQKPQLYKFDNDEYVPATTKVPIESNRGSEKGEVIPATHDGELEAATRPTTEPTTVKTPPPS